MKFTELKKDTDPIHYMIYTLFTESIETEEEAERIEVSIEETSHHRYAISVQDTKDKMGYGIHTKMNLYLGWYSAIVYIGDETNGDPMFAVFQHTNPIPFHVEYIYK